MQKVGFGLGLLAVLAGLLPILEPWICARLHGLMDRGAPPVSADVIAVLGGGGGDRIRRGLELMGEGYAPRILFVGTSMEMQFAHNEARAARRWAPGRLCFLEQPVQSTAEGARQLVAWARENQVRRVLVVSDGNHLGRLAAQLDALTPRDLDLQLVSSGHRPRLDEPRGRWRVLRETGAYLAVRLGEALRPAAPGGLPPLAAAGI